MPNILDRGVSCGRRGGSSTVVNLSFLDRSRYFLSSSSSFILTRAEWTPFQTHCYSDNLVALGIEPGTSGLAARNSDHQTTEAFSENPTLKKTDDQRLEAELM
jgi:hypothetical protein